MNKILSDYSASGQPFESPTHLDFWQNANKEAVANTVIAMIGPTYDAAKIYRLWGAVLTPAGDDNFTNTAGAVFYNGEVFGVNAVGGAGTTLVNVNMQVVETATDSTIFADGSTHSVNQVRKMKYFDTGTANVPVEIRLNTLDVNRGVIGTAETLTFNGNKNLYYVSAGGITTTLTFDTTGAIPGSLVRMIIPADSNDIALTSSVGVIKQSGTGHFNLLQLETVEVQYLGINPVTSQANYLVNYSR